MSDADSIPLAVIAEYRELIGDNFGLIFAASFVGMMFFGLVIAQLYIYMTRYPEDPTWMKVFVMWVFTLDICSAMFTTWWLYYLFVQNWGNIEVFEVGNWIIATDPLLLGLIACSVQIFFARRVKILTKNIYITVLICIFAISTLAGAVGGVAEFLIIRDFADFGKMKAVAILWLLSGCLGDVVITASLSWYLRRKKSGFQVTDRVVDKIIRVTMQNGLLTTVTAAVDLCLYLASPKPYHIALSIILPRMYLNTVLSSLNSRDWRRPETTTESGVISANNLRSLGARLPTAEVMVHVEAHEMVDTVKSDTDWESHRKQMVA